MGKIAIFASLGIVGLLALLVVSPIPVQNDQIKWLRLSFRPGAAVAGKALYSEDGVRMAPQAARDGGRAGPDAAVSGGGTGSSSGSCAVRVRTMDDELSALRATLASQRETVEQLDGRLVTVKANLDAASAANPSGVPASLAGSYSAQVDEYNGMVSQRRALVEQHNAGVDQEQAKVEERNAAARGCQ